MYIPTRWATILGGSSTALPAMVDYKTVWQTDKGHTSDVGSWRFYNQDWSWNQLDDLEAEKWVRHHFDGSKIEQLWKDLPTMILVRA